MKRSVVVSIVASVMTIVLGSSSASAGVWLELLRANCWTGSDSDIKENNGVIGEVSGSIDCFNKDFNGDTARTLVSIKAFQPWEYGFVFLYYDITGPFTKAGRDVTDNEKGGFFGGTTIGISPKKIAEKFHGKPYDWGPLIDINVKYEMEHVSKFGMLHYYGLQWDFKVPHLDFANVTTVIRDDFAFEGVDFQLGAAFQKSFSIGPAAFLVGGFFQWGLFGEGDAPSLMTEGRPFFLSQPQLLWDIGKAVQFTPAKVYVGFEYQLSVNRYLIEGKTENVLQGMVRWNI